jgi:hypothetical protein
MVLRETRPDLPRLSPPGRGNKKLALYAGLLAVLGAAVFAGVQLTASPGQTAAIVIPSAPAVTAVAPAEVGSGTTPGPVAGSQYAGAVQLNATGSQLATWNQTRTFCSHDHWTVANGSVYTDSRNEAVLTTNGQTGSCVALVSPQSFSAAVIEVYAYFPPLPGRPGTIADWTSLWLTSQANWPTEGELDAVEAEPVTGVNAAAWHWGSVGAEQSESTDGLTQQGTLPRDGANLTPGWHVVDIAYAQGFFAVYYDGRLFTSLASGVVTGAPLNLLITSSVTPDTSEIEQQIGGPPQNSDSQPAGLAVKYVKVWSFR